MIFGILLTLGSSFGQTFFISLSAPALIETFGLSNSKWGLIYSSATLISALCLSYFGRLLDRVPLMRFSISVCIGLAVACLILATAQYVWMVFLAVIGLRLCGPGLQGLTASTTMARAFAANRGRALSVASTGFPLGEILFPPLAVLVLKGLGWRLSWLVFAGILTIVILPLVRFLLSNTDKLPEALRHFDNKATNPQANSENEWNRSELFKDYRFYLILPAYITPAFIATGFILNQFLIAGEKQWSETLMANSFVAFGVCRLAFSLIVGPMIDRWKAWQIFPYYLIPLLVGIVLMIVYSHASIAVIYYGMMGVSVGIGSSISSALWAETYGTRHLASIKSMTMMIAVFSAAVSPVLFGWLLDHGISFNSIFQVSTVVILMFVLLSIPGCKNYQK